MSAAETAASRADERAQREQAETPAGAATGSTRATPPPLVLFYQGRPLSWARTALHNGRRITPKAQRLYKRQVGFFCAAQTAARQDWPSECPDTRFRVSLNFSLGDRRRCDVDNLCKAVLDACNGIAWRDDSQIDELHATKTHADKPSRFTMRVEVIR